MRGSLLSGVLPVWRGGEEEYADVVLRIHQVPPEEGRGYEVDVVSSSVELTDAEVERALAKFMEE